MKKSIYIWVSLVLLAVFWTLQVVSPKPVRMIRGQIFNAYQKWSPADTAPVPVTVLAIDRKSIRRFGQWPWPRDLLAEMVGQLSAYRADVIVFDLVFSSPDRTSPVRIVETQPLPGDVIKVLSALPDHDTVFRDALAKVRVVAGMRLKRKSRGRGRSLGKMTSPEFQGKAALKRALLKTGGAVVPLKPFLPVLKGLGFVNLPNSAGGRVRRLPLVIGSAQGLFPSLTLEALRVHQKARGYRLLPSMDGRSLAGIGVGDLDIPVDHAGRFWVRPPDVSKVAVVPAGKLLSGRAEPGLFKDRVVFVGVTAGGVSDPRSDPTGKVLSRVEFQARLAEQILNRQFLTRPEWVQTMEKIAIGLITGIGLIVLSRFTIAVFVVITVAMVSAVFAGAMYGFASAGLLIDPVVPGFGAALVLMISAVTRYAGTAKENRWIRDAFSSFVSPNLVEQLLKQPESLKLGGERRELSFVFTDLAGFTALVEKSEPGTLIPILNDYLNEMIAIGFRHGGTLDAIVGDATTFFFNAPVEQPDHAVRALECALEMDKFATGFSRQKTIEGYPLGETRIGIHTGPVIVGNMGGDVIFNYAAHGDAINTAARMEGVNKYLGTRVAVSIETASRCPDFHGRPVGAVVLKGKTTGIVAFQPLSPEEMETPRIKAYMTAYDVLTEEEAGLQEDGQALRQFQKLMKEFPEDPLIRFHCKRLGDGEKGTLIHMLEK